MIERGGVGGWWIEDSEGERGGKVGKRELGKALIPRHERCLWTENQPSVGYMFSQPCHLQISLLLSINDLWSVTMVSVNAGGRVKFIQWKGKDVEVWVVNCCAGISFCHCWSECVSCKISLFCINILSTCNHNNNLFRTLTKMFYFPITTIVKLPNRLWA